MNKTPALIAAFFITSLVGLIMAVVGWSAVNQSASDAQAQAQLQAQIQAQAVQAAAPAVDNAMQLQAQNDALNARVQEYQAREQQLVTQLDSAQQQAQVSAAENQQYSQLITALQDSGVIQIDANGQVTVQQPNAIASRPSFEHSDHDD